MKVISQQGCFYPSQTKFGVSPSIFTGFLAMNSVNHLLIGIPYLEDAGMVMDRRQCKIKNHTRMKINMPSDAIFSNFLNLAH